MHFEVMSEPAARPDHPVRALLEVHRKSYWSTASGSPHTLLLKLDRNTLLGYLKIANRSVSRLEIAVATRDEESEYVTVRTATRVPQNKVLLIRVGFLPVRFVRVRCLGGSPIALYFIQALGVPTSSVAHTFGTEYREMLVDTTRRLLLDPCVVPSFRQSAGTWSDA